MGIVVILAPRTSTLRRYSVYRILHKETLTPVTKLYVIEAPEVARKARAGQFIILRVHEEGSASP
jgi:ferredoxin--NADP+ reductase